MLQLFLYMLITLLHTAVNIQGLWPRAICRQHHPSSANWHQVRSNPWKQAEWRPDSHRLPVWRLQCRGDQPGGWFLQFMTLNIWRTLTARRGLFCDVSYLHFPCDPVLIVSYFLVFDCQMQDCTNPRYFAAGSSNAVKLSRFFDKVRSSFCWRSTEDFLLIHCF